MGSCEMPCLVLEPNAAISLQSIDDVVTVIPGQSRWWLALSRLTEALGDDNSVRKVFKRALAALFDKYEAIAISNGRLPFEGHCSTVSMPPGLAYDDSQASIDRRLGKGGIARVAMADFVSRNGDMHINCNKRGPPALPKPKKRKRRVEPNLTEREDALKSDAGIGMCDRDSVTKAASNGETIAGIINATDAQAAKKITDTAYEPNVV
jgi:hypothetical protein